MPSKRERVRGRKESGSFLALPHDCLNHDNFLKLLPHSVKLLIDIACQFKGNNNGDLCAAWSVMKKRGWRSQATLHRSKLELEYYGWIQKTRQGGRNQASLYAVTWKPIDECKGKLDVKETRVASSEWKKPKPDFKIQNN